MSPSHHPDTLPAGGPQSALLQGWLDHLSTVREEGLRAGLAECLSAHEVLRRLEQVGRLPADAGEQLALLAPVLCSSAEGQARYHVLLKAFLDSRLRIGKTQPPGGTGTAGTATPARSAWFRRVPWGWILATLIVLGVMGWSGREVARIRREAGTTSTNPPVVIPPQPSTNPFVAPPTNPDAFRGLVPNTTFRYHTNVVARETRAERPGDDILRQVAVALGILGLLTLLARVWRRSRGELFLRQVRTDRQVRARVLGDPEGSRRTPVGPGLRAVARRLRQRVAGDRRQLDLPGTIRATIQAGGTFSPRFSQARTTPEYVALIDVRHTFDLNADIASRWVERLRNLGVQVETFAFDTSPADGCWRWNPVNLALPTGPRLTPRSLAAQSDGRRLLVFAPAEIAIDRFTGEPQPWLKPFRDHREKAWFTPSPMESWSGAEDTVADDLDFLLLPSVTEALDTLAGWLSSGLPLLALNPGRPLGYPALLRAFPENWVRRPEAPEPEELKRLMAQLAAYLGPSGFEWLCACAVFPAVSPALTRWLGYRLEIAEERRALLEAALASLPFFRQAHLPPWLRRELLVQMTPQARDRTRTAIDECLNRAVPEAGVRLLEVAAAPGLLEPVRAWLRQGSGIVRDQILVEFLDRGPLVQLAYRVPERLRRWIFRDAQPSLGFRLGWVLAGLFLTTGMLTSPWWIPRQRGALKEIAFEPSGFLTTPAFTNTLGMVFVPVTNAGVWFSAWETRVQDYAAYAAENPKVDGSWKDPRSGGVLVTRGTTHPVVNVSWMDATNFCHWLTQREGKAGRLPAGYRYRLPTDLEWSAAVGLSGEQGETPQKRDGKVPGLYPWGRTWPPPAGSGNFADETAGRSFGEKWGIIAGYEDGYATTSPAGVFRSTPTGIYDLSGNAWEWCEDWYDGDKKFRVLRGGSWGYYDPDALLSSSRYFVDPGLRRDGIGFRVVLGVDGSAR